MPEREGLVFSLNRASSVITKWDERLTSMRWAESDSSIGKQTGTQGCVVVRRLSTRENGVRDLMSNDERILVGNYTKRCRPTVVGLSRQVFRSSSLDHGPGVKVPGISSATFCSRRTAITFTSPNEWKVGGFSR